MKKIILLVLLISLNLTNGFAQTYWNFIMDTCQSHSYAMGTFWKDNKFCAAIQENEYDGINKLKIISWDDQFVRHDLNTNLELNFMTYGSNDGIFKIKNGYLLNTTYSNQRVLNFNDSLQLNWSVDIFDSLYSSIGIPAYWAQDSITGDLYGTGYGSYSNTNSIVNTAISLVKLDSSGAVIFQKKYPNLLQNSPNYFNISGAPRYIRFINDTIYVCGVARQSIAFGDGQVTQIFCAKFDLDGNSIAVDFIAEKTSHPRVVNVNSSYYFVNQEFLNTSNANADTQLRIYYRETMNSQPQLIFEDASLLTTLYDPLISAINTTEGILILVDKSENLNVVAQLIMFDTQTNTIAWQKDYALNLDTTQAYAVQDHGMGYLKQLPDSGFAFSGNIRYLKNYPWYIRTDVCGNEIAGDCIQNRVENPNATTIATLSGFPNPCSENLTIKMNPNKIPTQLQFLNSVGQIIHSEIVNRRQIINLDTSTFPNGIYFVQALFENGSKEQIKIIKN